MKPTASRSAVLHVALNPLTGPWSVMRELAAAQAASGRFAGIGLGIIRPPDWPAAYRRELVELGLPVYERSTPRMFGTASFLLQAIRRPGIEAWVRDLAGRTGAGRVVVHFHNAWMTGVFLPLRPVPGIETVCVATFHGVNARLDGKPIRRAAHRWMARRLAASPARLTSVDRANVPIAERLFGLPRDRFVVIPNGVPAAPRPGCPYARGAAECFTVGHVGSLTERKGWRLAAEAVLRLARQGRRVRLVVAGSGDDAPRVEALAATHPDVISYRGFVHHPAKNLAPELDLLALLSAHEGLPMTLLEAQSAGVPAAATDVGGVAEAVRPGETGCLVERSADALAAVIRELYDDPGRLGRLHETTRRWFEDHFEIRRIVAAYADLYATGSAAPPRRKAGRRPERKNAGRKASKRV